MISLFERNERLEGLVEKVKNKLVEVDETIFFSIKYNRRRVVGF